MALDMTTPRTDVAFLRRRPHRPVAASTAPATSSATGGGLKLSGPSTASTEAPKHDPAPTTGKISFDRPDRAKTTAPAPATGGLSLRPASSPAPAGGGLSLKPEPAGKVQSSHGKSTGSSLSLRPKMDADLPKHSVPYFHNNLELSLDNPVVRLDFRQSGIGSLVIEGAQAFAWETSDKQGGLQVIGGNGSTEIEPPSFGRRKLVEFQDNDVIIGLRHAKNMRRIVVASQVSDLKVKMYDGSEIFMPSDAGKNVLLLTRIGHEIECRLEKVDSIDLLGVFAIKASHVSLNRTRP